MIIHYNTIQAPDPVEEQPVPKGRYFTFLTEADTHICQKDQYIASRKIGKHFFWEVKGVVPGDWRFTLQNKQRAFWMAFQFLGASSITSGVASTLGHQQYLGFFNENNEVAYRLKTGKIWMILIGMEMEDTASLAREWKTLRFVAGQPFTMLPTLNIAFRNKKILDQIQRIKDSPFSLVYKLAYHSALLLETYHGDLLEYTKSAEKEDISLFYRAKEYIKAHYMDEKINPNRIAKDLLTSRRTLYRVFREKGLAVNSVIQTMRIHKGREMLRTTHDSVDIIAFHLQFATAKYFIKQYVKYFGHTPARERELHPPPSISETP